MPIRRRFRARVSRTTLEAQKRRPEGLFEATLPETYKDKPDPANYRIRYKQPPAIPTIATTPTRSPSSSAISICTSWAKAATTTPTKSSARTSIQSQELRGVNFAVWAPSARRVSVVGDFNHWDGRVNPMRARGSSGIWEFFIPELDEGAIYKYEIIGARGDMLPLKQIPTLSAPNCGPAPAPSSPISTPINGMTPSG